METAMASFTLQEDCQSDFQPQKPEDFLDECKVNEEWKRFILSDNSLLKHLWTGLNLVNDNTEFKLTGPGEYNLLPKRELTLAALRYCKPEDVKVVIVGHDPIPDSELATGLAFSFPYGTTETDILEAGRGYSVRLVHKALRSAGIQPGFSLKHEHWAERGVLLLNACLTIDPGKRTERKADGGIQNPHFKYWVEFTCEFLLKLLCHLQKGHQDLRPVFVLCWGTQARDVGHYLRNNMDLRYDGDHSELLVQTLKPVFIVTGHHPTFPRNSEKKFLAQAENQFRAIKRYYPGLFDPDYTEVIKHITSALKFRE